MEAIERFQALAGLPDEAVPLDEIALLVAAQAARTPDIDAFVARYQDELDGLADTCPAPTLDGLVAHLFVRGRFRGNRDDYYDPRNSLLSEVLDRGLGIPITLSILAMEVGRRLGVPLAGVGMPGHFLLRDKVDPAVFVDPFHRGRLLDAEGCQSLHRTLTGGRTWDEGWLEPIGRWAIVARLLANLKAIYQQRHQRDDLLWVMQLRSLVPGIGAVEAAEVTRLMAPYN
jgi:regulator of sirC expression with transglutaminase-like and TPR domain